MGNSSHGAGSVRAAPYSVEHMFQGSVNRFRAFMAHVDDMLVGTDGDADVQADAGAAPAATAPHPHRRPVRINRVRRDGAVPPRPALCLCPVRSEPGVSRPVMPAQRPAVPAVPPGRPRSARS